MPRQTVLPAALLIGSILLLVLTSDRLSRRPLPSHEATHPNFALFVSAETLVHILCACLCGLGVMWITPWAAILPIASGSALIPGLVTAGLLIVASFYATAKQRGKRQQD